MHIDPKRGESSRRGIFVMPKIVRRFRKDEEGATAIEFGMLLMPFMLLLFGIIECSLAFFAGQMLESAVDNVGRKIRTGQLDNSLTQAQFKTEICNETSILFTCNNLKIDLEVAATFDDLNDPPTPVNGVLDNAAYTFTPPCPEQIAMVTVSYDWPSYTNLIAERISDLSSGGILLNAVAVFRTEPYPANSGGAAC
jgi:Flp pilus assembly protein TadG